MDKSTPLRIIYLRAIEVFEKPHLALNWLNTEIKALNNLSPIEFLKAENGVQKVLEVLF